MKGVSKLWAGLAVSLVGSGILAASLAPHESLVHDVGRPWKPNEDKIPNVSNAPIGAGAAANSALPPTKPWPRPSNSRPELPTTKRVRPPPSCGKTSRNASTKLQRRTSSRRHGVWGF
eukprot:GHVT01044024.1.p1 GENE.GHVT01044024.1~~GHVT01044024.1.p1  ORF type:complete len:118 (-),score=22.95 GHVT01044024.1:402-755(-)